MTDPYWPWWAVITFFASGAFSSWIIIASLRPPSVDCPNCHRYVRTRTLRDHWKVCIS